jgi:hypothetical protein
MGTKHACIIKGHIFLLLCAALPLMVTATIHPGDGRAAIGFIENKGQLVVDNERPDTRTLYYFQGMGMDVCLRSNGFSYVLWMRNEEPITGPCDDLPDDGLRSRAPAATYASQRIDVTFEQASAQGHVEADDPRAGYFNYYTTGLPVEGITQVRHFGTVTYHDLYPHIDVVFHLTEKEGRAAMKYDLVVHPGGDLSAIRMRYEGAAPTLTPDGLLVLETPLGPMEERIPESWHQQGKRRTEARVRTVALEENIFGFRDAGSSEAPVGATLVIDPVPTVSWAVTYDDSDAEAFQNCTFDAAGYAYGAGYRAQPLFNGGTSAVIHGESDMLLVKYDGAGQLMWMTFIGGSGGESAEGIAVSPTGDVVVGGRTDSPDVMSTPGAWQGTYGGGFGDGFIAKFNQWGWRVWSTYYGGTLYDHVTDLACDPMGRIVVTGSAESTGNIASANAADPTHGGAYDMFVAQFSPTGARQWGTYLGGSHDDYGRGVATNGTSIMVTGSTSSSTGISTPGAFQSVSPAAGPNAYLARYQSATGAKVWCTYYGGAGTDEGHEVVLEDYTSNIYVCGETYSSTGIASAGAHQPAPGGQQEGFLAKFNATGQRFWGTYLGGAGDEEAFALRLTNAGRLYVTGKTMGSSQGIASADALYPTHTGNQRFLMRYSSDGDRIWGTYLPSKWGLRLDAREVSYQVFGTTFRYTLLLIGGFIIGQPVLYTSSAHLACVRESHNQVFGADLEVQPSIEVHAQTNGTLRVGPVPDPEEEEAGVVTVFDLQGRLVHEENWRDIRVPLRLDLGGRAVGVHVVRITTPTRSWSTKVSVSP